MSCMVSEKLTKSLGERTCPNAALKLRISVNLSVLSYPLQHLF